MADPTYWREGEPGWANLSGYRGAAVCKRGHTKSSSLIAPPDEGSLGFCPTCGAQIVGRCRSCNVRIRGSYLAAGISNISKYSPPGFCDGCGGPHPWATREQRIFQLENLLDEDALDEATRLLVREDLDRLRAPAELDDKRQLEIWKRVKSNAPELFKDAGLKISVTLLNAYLQQQLGLK